ncbi:hypothetical protein SPRG_19038 [Saprolegnia parasitica CBS 223.65]|uniref:WD repeat-containing protein 60 n=1 Tax=Saprolegnia parasitica (strain CBS 223.65) TaxID=695850 RepID=A0A067CY92_SAPPC|nr:hypothetical protein SPRG_19038 [Saprolegnia parasitica CBS 223.65]KDO34195.1 hypothetical protein SPRG_19038 [Saprolegnia parasitica CBS 223.65]|eukprot:XP_012195236.1 hypothetical protein SPRG_19038 [Saprolegnia parasitica CBS 223.65]
MAEPKADDDDVKREMKKAAKKASKKAAPDAGPAIATPKTPPAATPSKPKTPPAAAATKPPSMTDVPKMNLSSLGAAEPKPSSAAGDEKAKKKSSKKRPDPAVTGPAPTATAIPATPAVTSPTSAAVPKDDNDEEEKARQAARREAKRLKQKELEEAKRRKDELERQALELARREEEARQRELRKAQELAALNANAEECQEEEDYDDDFENYEGDRADEPVKKPAKASNNNIVEDNKPDDETVKKIREALQAESKSRSSTPTSSAKSTSRAESKEAKKAPSNNVSSSIAGLKQAVDPRAKRIKEILEKKKFEVEKFDVFQLAPSNDLDKYMQQLRVGAVRQVFVQTNDDARGVSTQTEHGDAKDFGMHFPDDRGHDDHDSTSSSSSRHFMNFLERAAHVCEVLAEENVLRAIQAASRKDGMEMTHHDPSTRKLAQLETAHVVTEPQPLLADRTLVDVTFSATVSHWLLAAYSPSVDNNNESVAFSDKSILCVWDINQLQSPLRWLRAEGNVTCCNLGPNRDLFAFCGTEEGDVQLWDLRHPVSPNFEVHVSGRRLKVAPPSYATAGMKYARNSHASPICSVVPIPSGKKGATFQIGSLDNRGRVIFWGLVESAADATDALDSCVEIGGRVRLVKTSVIDTAPTVAFGPTATLLAVLPSDTSLFVVGSHSGKLQLHSRFEKKLPPFLPTYLLVGYADGSVRLFDKGLAHAIASWAEAPTSRVAVVGLQWSPSRSAVFFVHYSNGDVGVWDLLASSMSSVLVQRVTTPSGIMRLSIATDVVKTCPPMLAVISHDEPNQLRLHALCPPLTSTGAKEAQAVHAVLQGVV